jgi:hypothetical protein
MSIASAVLAGALALAQADQPANYMNREEFLSRRYEKALKVDTGGPFGHKDPEAARMVGKSLEVYVVEGMTAVLRDRLFRMFREMSLQGLDACINSGYRGPERQAMIKAGIRAPVNGSYHGGSPKQRGHGLGLAADIVSCLGGANDDERYAHSLVVWRWIDKHGTMFKLGRPYMFCDSPHVGPSDGAEYHAKHPTAARRFADGSDDFKRCPQSKRAKKPNKKKKIQVASN